MTGYNPYDVEGKERIVHIANYVREFVREDEQYPEDVEQMVRNNVQQDTYLLEEYGEDDATGVVMGFL